MPTVQPTRSAQHGWDTRCARHALASRANSGGCHKPSALNKTYGDTPTRALTIAVRTNRATVASARQKEPTMTPTLESTTTDPVNSVFGNGANTPEDLAPNSMVYVYGHGPTRNPFYEEARALSGNEK